MSLRVLRSVTASNVSQAPSQDMRIDVVALSRRTAVVAALLATTTPPLKASCTTINDYIDGKATVGLRDRVDGLMLRERDQAVLLDVKLPCLNVKGKQTCSVRDFLDENKYVVLYFYPDDPTHIEDALNMLEVLNFQKEKPSFDELDTVLLGISNMNLAAQQKMVDSKLLTIPFVSDPSQKLAAAYGAERATFVIDPKGTIRWLERNVEYGVGNFNLQNHATRVARQMYTIHNNDGWSV